MAVFLIEPVFDPFSGKHPVMKRFRTAGYTSGPQVLSDSGPRCGGRKENGPVHGPNLGIFGGAGLKPFEFDPVPDFYPEPFGQAPIDLEDILGGLL